MMKMIHYDDVLWLVQNVEAAAEEERTRRSFSHA
jgi:hypothetical protein